MIKIDATIVCASLIMVTAFSVYVAIPCWKNENPPSTAYITVADKKIDLSGDHHFLILSRSGYQYYADYDVYIKLNVSSSYSCDLARYMGESAFDPRPAIIGCDF